MAKLLDQFNVEASEKMGDFSVIPADKYIAQIIKSEVKETKAGDGHYLALQFQVIEGEYNGRIVFERLNIQNKNPQTVEIAQKTLATIGEICGLKTIDDSEQLHNVPMEIRVIVKPAEAQYSEQNEIKGYKSVGALANNGVDSEKTPPWKQ
jgi:hypothetical protein